MKRLWILVVTVPLAAFVQAQNPAQKSVARKTPQATESLNVFSLKVEGLNHDRDVDRLYWGDFDRVQIERSNFAFSIMIDTYMRNFGVVCKNDLPKNAVEIMNSKCDEETYKVYASTGFEVPGSRYCSNSHPVGSGILADPDLYQAYSDQSKLVGLGMIGQLGSTLSKPGKEGANAALGMNVQNMDSFKLSVQLASDMKVLIANNACGGASLRRFEKNLEAYATDRTPIRMGGIPTHAETFHDSDYQKLLDDLVAEQSSAWVLNRFQPNSVANVQVDARDGQGRPTLISANYAYQSVDKPAEGKVQLRFEKGLPRCLVYADIPDTCRSVGAKIVTAFEDGKYVTDHAEVSRTYVAPDLRQVQVIVDQSQPVVIEVPGSALSARQGIVVGTRGKLVSDLRGNGPGGSIVLVPAGSPVTLSVLNTQRSVKLYLSRVGGIPAQAIQFPGTPKEFAAGSNALPRDGSAFNVSFDAPADVQKTMLLSDFQKSVTATGGTVSQPHAAAQPVQTSVNSTADGYPSAVPSRVGQHRVLPAGSLLYLRVTNPIDVEQVGSGKLFPATVMPARSFASRNGDALPEGTVVFVKVSQGNGRQYLLEADHAVVQGMNVPLSTNVEGRVPVRNTLPRRPIQIGTIGPLRIPPISLDPGSTILLPAEATLSFITRSDAVVDGVAR